MISFRLYAPSESLLHKGFPLISESPERLLSLYALFKDMGLKVLSSPKASRGKIALAHKDEYVEHVRSLSQMNIFRATLKNVTSPYVQWYTRISSGSYNAALHAVGAVCQAVQDVHFEVSTRAFCAVRPPGHHAGPAYGEGFCIFNNVAIGALYAQSLGFAKVAIVDFDVHHGNGTEAVVLSYGNRNLFLASSYQEGCEYATKNRKRDVDILHVPIPENSSFKIVYDLYDQTILPQLREFQPDLILVSAGFDMHYCDPLKNLSLSATDYYLLMRMLIGVANECCNGKIISVLEGGYHIPALTDCVKEHISAIIKP